MIYFGYEILNYGQNKKGGHKRGGCGSGVRAGRPRSEGAGGLIPRSSTSHQLALAESFLPNHTIHLINTCTHVPFQNSLWMYISIYVF